eukprot:5052329-Prymnesium_polylepis.1
MDSAKQSACAGACSFALPECASASSASPLDCAACSGPLDVWTELAFINTLSLEFLLRLRRGVFGVCGSLVGGVGWSPSIEGGAGASSSLLPSHPSSRSFELATKLSTPLGSGAASGVAFRVRDSGFRRRLLALPLPAPCLGSARRRSRLRLSFLA